MSTRAELLHQAALCYADAHADADAARCYDALGLYWTAARAHRRAGDLELAAETYRRAGNQEQAARCYRLLGLTDRAVQGWEALGRPLEAAWELLLVGRPAGERLPTAEQTTSPDRAERLALALALQQWQHSGRTEAVLRALAAAEQRLSAIAPRTEQHTLLEWSVAAAERIGRPDWGSRLFAAAYQQRGTSEPGTGDIAVLRLWRSWAEQHLGGTAGLPGLDTAGVADD